MIITRHYLTINGRKGNRLVHYRRSGSGPPLIMVHQSPRSSAEYEGLMREWGAYFTCIAPDTPGFGQSEPLSTSDPDINDYADALVEFIRELGLEKTAAYGFHSGGIILVTALKRHPEAFTGLAIGGYAIWNAAEMAIFGEAYLPPFLPAAYGEHLTWLWNRILEQSWFFPWFDVRGEARLSVAHDDPARVHAVVMDMLDSGDAYRFGYGAVLRAPRDIPPPDAVTPPVLITAYDGDPLQAHIDRLGAMPAGWAAAKVATPKAHQDSSLAFLLEHQGTPADHYPEDQNQGFLYIRTAQFDGLIHWHGPYGAERMIVHAPGRAGDLIDNETALRIDLPGHGLSSDWNGDAPQTAGAWQRVIDAVVVHFSITSVVHEPCPVGEPDRLFPALHPDRMGAYLITAWSIIRAQHFFAPWYKADAAHAITFDSAALDPARLAREHRARIRARAARAYHIALTTGGQDGNS
jgi:pimeloyl-ACP methyl ester carboxylesterase